MTIYTIGSDMDLDRILNAGESDTVEFKSAFGKGVGMTLAAFANTHGGKVVVGVDNKGRPIGIEVGLETEQRYLNEIKMATYPQIMPKVSRIKSRDKHVLVFAINDLS